MYKELLPKPCSKLINHARRFEKRIEKVTEGVYSAIGYALGNSILIVTKEGNVIIDTTESQKAALEIKEEFDQISNLPTRAVIYTHAHPDHIWGTSVFINEDTEVYAHKSFKSFFNQQYNQLWPILTVRGVRQFGSALPRGYVPCAGLGPFLRFKIDTPPIFVYPTTVFENELELTFGDEKFMLAHAPGETDDQIFVWLPERKVLFCGDNYYPAFPNLYTIRGTSPRPVQGWIDSLDKMRDLDAEYLVGSHAEPVRGASRIEELLTVYRDAIQFVHDAVIRGANKGKSPEQLAEEIKLPLHLARYPELAELYGSVSWSVRAIYNGYLGWFDGNATGLVPLPPAVRAMKMINLAGGKQKLCAEADQGLENDEYQWAAEIADMLLAVNPDCSEAKEIKIKALFKMGERTDNSNARSYYLTQALELAEEVKFRKNLPKVNDTSAHRLPLETIFNNMAISLDPIVSKDMVISVGFRFTDSSKEYGVIIRNGIPEIRSVFPKKPSLVINISENSWKEIALGICDPRQLLESGLLKVEGELPELSRFFSVFKNMS